MNQFINTAWATRLISFQDLSDDVFKTVVELSTVDLGSPTVTNPISTAGAGLPKMGHRIKHSEAQYVNELQPSQSGHACRNEVLLDNVSGGYDMRSMYSVNNATRLVPIGVKPDKFKISVKPSKVSTNETTDDIDSFMLFTGSQHISAINRA